MYVPTENLSLKNPYITSIHTMKKILQLLAVTLIAVSSSQADTVFQSDSHAISANTNDRFSFNQFDSSLGTLTGVTFSSVSCVNSGSFNEAATNGVKSNATSIKANYVSKDIQNGAAELKNNYVSAFTTPGMSGFQITNSSQTFTLSEYELFNNTASRVTNLSANLDSYIGSGLVSFDAAVIPNQYSVGGPGGQYVSFNFDNWVTTYGLSLTYDYTVAAVPEPSTYALLGMGALGMGMAMRRKKTA